jgi:predicted naringenin-chalcone synthase
MNAGPSLAGLGIARPPWTARQEDLSAAIADALGLDGAIRGRWDRIVKGSGIDTRGLVAEPESLVSTIVDASTATRMLLFAEHAPPLALDAARRALADARLRPERVTDCIVVTCTGFTAPGVGARLATLLGLRSSVRHTQIGFMGCFGGVLGLRAAVGMAAADPAAVVLVVCVECCSLHLRRDLDPQNLVASALFGDGASAAIVVGQRVDGAAHRGSVGVGRTELVPGTEDAMTWTITDTGFAMTLARSVPGRLEAMLPGWFAGDPPTDLVVHPGGPGILDAVERAARAADLGARAVDSIQSSRAVLARSGNMSSGTILAVLDEHLRRCGSADAGCVADLVAFGPGLTIDAVRFTSIGVVQDPATGTNQTSRTRTASEPLRTGS